MLIHVTPKDGYKIRDPYKKDHLPPEGREVADSFYWQRLASDEDVEISAADPRPAKAAAPAKEAPTAKSDS